MTNHQIADSWSWLTAQMSRDGVMAAAVAVLFVLLLILWWYRARTRRRWKAVLDAYADGQIAFDH